MNHNTAMAIIVSVICLTLLGGCYLDSHQQIEKTKHMDPIAQRIAAIDHAFAFASDKIPLIREALLQTNNVPVPKP